MDALVDIFCDVDDFCRVFIPEWEKHQLADGSRKRQRDSRMTTSEIMTIIILVIFLVSIKTLIQTYSVTPDF
jgi:hypothetical protein